MTSNLRLVERLRAVGLDSRLATDAADEIEWLCVALAKADALARLTRSFAGDAGLNYEHQLWDALDEFDTARLHLAPEPGICVTPGCGRAGAVELADNNGWLCTPFIWRCNVRRQSACRSNRSVSRG